MYRQIVIASSSLAPTLAARGACALRWAGGPRVSTLERMPRAAARGWEPDNAVRRLREGFSGAKFRSRSHDAVNNVYDETGNVIETHEHKSGFKEW
jgi:hypothetical protein